MKLKFNVLYTPGRSARFSAVHHLQVSAEDRNGAVGLAHAAIPPGAYIISVTWHADDLPALED